MPIRHGGPADAQRARLAAQRKRAEREARRHIVPLKDRPRDDCQIDRTAVDYALRGWRQHAVRLRRTELVEAVRVGTERGLGAPALADLLCLHEREVSRLRAEGRAAMEGRAA